jgi:hypothetical protein
VEALPLKATAEVNEFRFAALAGGGFSLVRRPGPAGVN